MEPTERTLESVMKIHKMLKDLCGELKRDVKVLTDPEVRALFESTTRSVETYIRALLDFEQKNMIGSKREKS
jgi:hypothetical protein